MNKGKAGAGFLAGSLLLFMILCTVRADDMASSPVDPLELSLIYYTESGYASGQGTSSGSITGDTLIEDDTESRSSIVGSVNDNQGIMSINQSSGSINNQSNVRIVSLSPDLSAITEIRIERSPELNSNKINTVGGIKQDLIDKSFRDNVGIMGVNQAAGNFNHQGNTAVVVMGGLVSLTEADLNNVRASNNDRAQKNIEVLEDIIRDSFSNSQGIFQVTQSAGDLNILENNLGLSIREIYLK
jgi:hypothetical protein